MSFIPLDIPPGVVKTRSGEGAAGRWKDANNVRFVKGKPRKRAGHTKLNTAVIEGTARGMLAWNKINGNGLYSVGTNSRLYGSTDGADVINITPLRVLQSWVNKLSVTANLGAVKVSMTAHGFSLGKQFKIFGNSYMGGSAISNIALNGIWELVSVIDADNFYIYPTAGAAALGGNPIATTNTSTTVTITHTSHGHVVGDSVWIAGATAVGGITIAGDYKIQSIVDANNYNITHSAPAGATTTGGGSSVTAKYSVCAATTVANGGGTVPYNTYLTNPFTTTSGQKTVTVAHTAHGALTNDHVTFSGASAVGGLTISGEYTLTVVDANSYTIEAASNAASSTSGGGTVLAEYEISPGSIDKIVGHRGFGMGPLGAGPFGTSTSSSSVYYDPRSWAIDHNGEDGLMTPLGGGVYYWDSSVGGRADLIAAAPGTLRYMFMTDERHLHALGLNGDAMLMGWASQDVLDDWTPTATNTANNSRRVREGSKLIAGASVGNGMNLIWTDTACYKHQYTGSSFVYDTQLDATESGLIGPLAFTKTPKGVMWMSQTRFKMWAGVTQDIPNASDVESWVYENMDPDQRSKAFASFDAINNAVDFYFVPNGGSEPTWYVTVDLDDFTWVNGVQTRTCGSMFQEGSKNPLRVLGQYVYQHEVGYDADGAAADSYITLAPYEIQGSYQSFEGFDPDFREQTGDVVISLSSYDRNDANPIDSLSETFGSTDELVDFRGEGRRISLTISQNVLGGFWSLDKPQIDVKPRARRR